MINERTRSDYGVRIHRRQAIHTALTVLIGLLLIASLAVFFIGWRHRVGNEKKRLLQLWEEGSYEEVFGISEKWLENKPMDYFYLTLYGFASYQLAVAQINAFDTLTYIDKSIWSLRKALLFKEGAADFRVPYVLGKCYYYKGLPYADLAVKYLEEAQRGSYNAGDIPEYLGLAYASIHDYRSSVSAFSLALNNLDADYPSDILLLSIARSYMALEEFDSARAYLVRCLENSRDFKTRVSARLLLGDLLGKAGDSAAAEAQYLAILEESGENAEAHYQLGELYTAGGDPTRARAEYRKAVRIDPAHRLAKARLNM
jgi:tetratricopeptide (TPR) repeat protein